jgi:predicted patatin/cPLA2 family phospholipase
MANDTEALAQSGHARPPSRLRSVLVIEGGGLRGAFCAGALEALDRLGHARPEALFATSAGGPSAAYLRTGQIHRAVQLWENRTHAHHLVSPWHLVKRRPLMDIDKLVDCFRSQPALDIEQFDRPGPDVFITVTHCESARARHVKMTKSNAFDLLTAGMALPLAYGRTVRVDGDDYIDGGLTDSIPIERALELGAERVLVVLTQPTGYRKRRSKVAERAFALQYRRYPALVGAFEQRFARYNGTLELVERLEAEGVISVLRPREALPASRMTRSRELILKTIQLGRDAAREWLSLHAERRA